MYKAVLFATDGTSVIDLNFEKMIVEPTIVAHIKCGDTILLAQYQLQGIDLPDDNCNIRMRFMHIDKMHFIQSNIDDRINHHEFVPGLCLKKYEFNVDLEKSIMDKISNFNSMKLADILLYQKNDDFKIVSMQCLLTFYINNDYENCVNANIENIKIHDNILDFSNINIRGWYENIQNGISSEMNDDIITDYLKYNKKLIIDKLVNKIK
jgi:hypothetical protein